MNTSPQRCKQAFSLVLDLQGLIRSPESYPGGEGHLQVTELNLRPLLYVAGAAIATAGLRCWYSRVSASQQRMQTTVDAPVQTEPEDPEQPHLDELHVGEPAMDVHQGLGPSLEDQITQEHCKEMLNSHQTLRLSFRQRLHSGMICVRQHFTLLVRSTVSQSLWVHTNDFYEPSAEGLHHYASEHRVTFAVHMDGRLARVASYGFTELKSSTMSCGAWQRNTLRAHAGFVLSDERCVVTVPCGSEVVPYNPTPQSGTAPRSGHSDFHQEQGSSRPQPGLVPERDIDRARLEARQAPALYYYCRTKGIEGFTLKLNALRQAFTNILSVPWGRYYICAYGRFILVWLAFLYDRCLSAFHRAYDTMISEIEDPSNRVWIEVELAQIGIQQFNLMDVCFELVLLGILGRARIFQITSRRNGFLGHLMTMISSCTAASSQKQPRADLYLKLLQNEMLLLLEDIFTLEESLYGTPDALVAQVKICLWQHMEEFLKRLEEENL